MMSTLISAIVGATLVIGAFFGFYEPKSPVPDGYSSIEQYLQKTSENYLNSLEFGANVQTAGLHTYNLSGSGLSSSATSIGLTSLTLPQNDYAIQDSDLSSTFYISLEPGNVDRQEYASCTTVVQNSGGTATLSGCVRGLSPISPYTASSSLQFAHGGGTKVIFSNPPQLYEQFTAKTNNETISALWLFGTIPYATTTATSTSQFATRGYAEGLANAGAATSTETNGGIVELGTLSEQQTSFDGGSTKPTVLQTKNSTSSCQVIGAYNIVASSTTGKLDIGCLDATATTTWTGGHTFNNATTTFNSGVDIDADANSPIILNGRTIVLPSTAGASSTVLSTDGGSPVQTLTWNTLPEGMTLLTSTTTEQDMSFATTSTFASASVLKVYIDSRGLDGGTAFKMYFNSDAVIANYGSTCYENYINPTTSGDAGTQILLDGTSTTSAQWLEVTINNQSAFRKMVSVIGGANSSGAATPKIKTCSGVWNNASVPITRIVIGANNTAQKLLAGAKIYVFGK